LATGWTALAACQLVEKLGGVVDSINCAVDLSFLPGREVLRTYTVNSLISY
jgi:adenine phosphoribosyltransferase